MEHKRFLPQDNGMARIVPALIANHPVGPLREKIHDLPFSFVPPLGSDHHQCRHFIPSQKSPDPKDQSFRTIPSLSNRILLVS
jgi:hypothetical protein